jgi:hypothetical protein
MKHSLVLICLTMSLCVGCAGTRTVAIDVPAAPPPVTVTHRIMMNGFKTRKDVLAYFGKSARVDTLADTTTVRTSDTATFTVTNIRGLKYDYTGGDAYKAIGPYLGMKPIPTATSRDGVATWSDGPDKKEVVQFTFDDTGKVVSWYTSNLDLTTTMPTKPTQVMYTEKTETVADGISAFFEGLAIVVGTIVGVTLLVLWAIVSQEE